MPFHEWPRHERQRAMLDYGQDALEALGYRVTRVPGRAQVWLAEMNDLRQRLIVRTSNDRWVGFAYDTTQEGAWITLGRPDIDAVLIVAVDRVANPQRILTYPPIPRSEMLERLNAHRAARVAAGQNVQDARNFVALDRYDHNVYGVGSGVIDGRQPIGDVPARVFRRRLPVSASEEPLPSEQPQNVSREEETEPSRPTLIEWKRRIALAEGLPEEAVEITIRV
jgi:hypothetical protein